MLSQNLLEVTQIKLSSIYLDIADMGLPQDESLTVNSKIMPENYTGAYAVY